VRLAVALKKGAAVKDRIHVVVLPQLPFESRETPGEMVHAVNLSDGTLVCSQSYFERIQAALPQAKAKPSRKLLERLIPG
jgi:hypothetical protein